MKLLFAFVLLRFATGGSLDAPYAPRGFRPEGEPFTLPPSRFSQQNNLNNQYEPSRNQYNSPQTQYGVPNRPQIEYGAPNVPSRQFPEDSDIDTQRIVGFNPQTQTQKGFRDFSASNVQQNINGQRNTRYPQTQYGTPDEVAHLQTQRAPDREYLPQNFNQDNLRVVDFDKLNRGQFFTKNPAGISSIPKQNKQIQNQYSTQQNNQKRISPNESFDNVSISESSDQRSDIPAQEYGPPPSTTKRTVARTRKPLRTQEATTKTNKPATSKISRRGKDQNNAEPEQIKPKVAIANAFAGRYYLLQPSDGKLQQVDYKTAQSEEEANRRILTANFILQNAEPVQEPIFSYGVINAPFIRLNK